MNLIRALIFGAEAGAGAAVHRVDRQQAWAAGLGIASIAGTLQPLFTGQRATLWEDPNGYSHDVVVVYPDSMRSSAADVSERYVDAAVGSGSSLWPSQRSGIAQALWIIDNVGSD